MCQCGLPGLVRPRGVLLPPSPWVSPPQDVGQSCAGASLLPRSPSCSSRRGRQSLLCSCVPGACEKTFQMSLEWGSVKASLRHVTPSEVRRQGDVLAGPRSKHSVFDPQWLTPVRVLGSLDSVVLFPNRVHDVCFKYIVFLIRRKE